VDTASRLEATGVPGFIHVTRRVMEILGGSRIRSGVSLLARAVARERPDPDFRFSGRAGESPRIGDLPFLDWYASGFQDGPRVVEPFGPVAFKEFFRESTRLIRCVGAAGQAGQAGQAASSGTPDGTGAAEGPASGTGVVQGEPAVAGP
jgi:hypothetical protein